MNTAARPSPERFYSEKVEGTTNVEGRGFTRALFVDCHFTRLRNAVLTRCRMENCSLDPEDIRDLLGVTITLDCNTWNHFRVSPLALDAILYLVTQGASENEKSRIRSVISTDRVRLFERLFPRLEYGAPNDGL